MQTAKNKTARIKQTLTRMGLQMVTKKRTTDTDGENGHLNRRNVFDKTIIREIVKLLTVFILGGGATGVWTYSTADPSTDLAVVKTELVELKKTLVPPGEHLVVMDHVQNKEIHLSQETRRDLVSHSEFETVCERLSKIEDKVDKILDYLLNKK